jgi:hypothetical protein
VAGGVHPEAVLTGRLLTPGEVMTPEQFTRDQENEAFGAFLIQAVADRYGITPEAWRIEKAVYKGTDCGAWIKFDSEGIRVGTIVEGSDAEYSERIDLAGVEMTDDGATLVADRVSAALQRCEEFAEENWGN